MNIPVRALVPHSLVRHLAGHPARAEGFVARGIPAVALHVHMVGFERITASLASRGVEGAEQVVLLLNDLLDPLVERIEEHGGEVVRIGGDSVLVAWYAPEGDLAEAARRAVTCAETIRCDYGYHRMPGQGQVALRAGMGAGTLHVGRVGGVGGRWELVLWGEPVRQASVAVGVASTGGLVCSGEVYRRIMDDVEAVPVGDLSWSIQELRRPISPVPLGPCPDEQRWEPVWRGLLPEPVLDHLSRDIIEKASERRIATLLCVRWSDPRIGDHQPLRAIHEVLAALQEEAARGGAMLDRVRVDERGPSAFLAFGMHRGGVDFEVDQALEIGLDIRHRLEGEDRRFTVGITTGPVYWGLVGSQRRCAFSPIGPAVDLAARLACRPPGIYCDTATHERASPRFQRSAVAEDSSVSYPLEARTWRVEALSEFPEGLPEDKPTYGRDRELTVITEALDRLEEGHGATLFVEGRAGMGKTHLVDHLRREASLRGYRVLVGRGRRVDRRRTYGGWRAVVRELLGLGDCKDPARWSEVLRERLGPEERTVRLAPLLNHLLPVDLEETEESRSLVGRSRAERTGELVARLLEQETRRRPVTVVLDDAQWMDSASWGVAFNAARLEHPPLLCIAFRSMADRSGERIQKWILGLPGTVHVRLQRMPEASVARYAAHLFGTARCPPVLVSWLESNGQGSPFLVGVLAEHLRREGLVATAEGRFTRIPEPAELKELALPAEIKELLLRRFDGLGAVQKTLLKVASVIGATFDLEMLRRTLPDRIPEHVVVGELENLVDEGLVVALPASEPPAWAFDHALVQNVIYHGLTEPVRLDLHAEVARALEERETVQAPATLLAWHWGRAERHEQALTWLERAGSEAARAGLCPEVREYYRAVLERAERVERTTGRSFPPERWAHWEFMLGDAALGLGDLGESRGHLHRTLEWLGISVPRHRVGAAFAMGTQALSWGLASLRGRLQPSPREREPDERWVTAARAMERLAELAIYDLGPLPMIYYVLGSVNFVRRAGHPATLARPFARFGFLAFGARRYALARAAFQRALRIADANRDFSGQAVTLYFKGGCHMARGEWKEAREACSHALEVSRRNSDGQVEGMAQTVVGMIDLAQGWLESALDVYRDLSDSARHRSHAQQEAWALYGMAECLLRMQRNDEAEAHLREALEVLDRVPDPASELICHGLLAAACQRRGNADGARRAAERAEQLMAGPHPTFVYPVFEGYLGLLEYYFACWTRRGEAGAPAAELATLRRQTRRLCRCLGRLARLFPILRVHAELAWGRYHHHAGRRSRALRCWHRAGEAASRWQMRYEERLVQELMEGG